MEEGIVTLGDFLWQRERERKEETGRLLSAAHEAACCEMGKYTGFRACYIYIECDLLFFLVSSGVMNFSSKACILELFLKIPHKG